MTGLAIWAAVKRFWPALAAVAVLLAIWGWGNSRFDAGVAKERQSWQLARAELLELRRQRADWSAADLARKIDAIPAATTKETVRVETHWRNRPVRDCFDADLVRSLEQARAAVRQSASASASGAAVPTGSDAAATSDRPIDGKVGH